MVLFLLWASCPAAAAGEELRVIAVNTASAPRVSMVVQPPAELPDNGATAESCSVTIDEESVACTVTPMASDSLSVALVIDTASDLTAQELAAVQSGAIDFLLGLPQEAHSMVVAAGGEPQVVAPLRENAAEALSAISALEVGGSRATSAATRLAAESMQSGPPGPRVIIVYTHGLDEQGVLVDQLSEAVLQANAVVNVIPASAESIWPSVVDRTGGVVLPPTGAADLAQSYGHLAAMLSEQYLVTFQAPVELPAEAQVALQSADQEYSTVVDLPDADTSGEAAGQPTGRGTVVLFGLVLVVLVLAVLALVRRTRRRASVGSGPPAEAAVPTASTPPAPAPAMPATDEEGGGRPSDGAPASTADTAPANPPLTSPSRRGSLSAAVQGRRSAEQALNPAPEQQVRRSSDDPQPEAAPDAKQARRRKSAAGPKAAGPPAGTPPAPAPAMPAAEEEVDDRPSDGAPSSTVATAPANPPLTSPSRRGSLSAAVQGRRSAEQALNPAPEQQARRSSDDPQPEAAPNAKQARRRNGAIRPEAATTGAEPGHPGRLSKAGSAIGAPAAPAGEQRSGEEDHDATVLTGSGDAKVKLTKNAPGPAAVRITGNAASQYFAVRTVHTDKVLVIPEGAGLCQPGVVDRFGLVPG